GHRGGGGSRRAEHLHQLLQQRRRYRHRLPPRRETGGHREGVRQRCLPDVICPPVARLEKELAMTQIDKVLYTAKAHTTGGRDGPGRSSDGRLDGKLSSPGAAGDGTNPEQLFAVGWSACFLGALGVAASKMKVALPPERAIDAEVDLGTTEGAYLLRARL